MSALDDIVETAKKDGTIDSLTFLYRKDGWQVIATKYGNALSGGGGKYVHGEVTDDSTSAVESAIKKIKKEK
jgi:hypothetical protein